MNKTIDLGMTWREYLTSQEANDRLHKESMEAIRQAGRRCARNRQAAYLRTLKRVLREERTGF